MNNKLNKIIIRKHLIKWIWNILLFHLLNIIDLFAKKFYIIYFTHYIKITITVLIKKKSFFFWMQKRVSLQQSKISNKSLICNKCICLLPDSLIINSRFIPLFVIRIQAMHTMRKNTNLTPHSQRTMGRKKK